MKNVLLAFVVLSISVVVSFGQKNVLTEAEFNAIWKKGCETTKAVTHISTETNEDYYEDAKPPHHSYISVKRYIPLDRVWTIAGRKDSKAEEKYEEIRIGTKSFSREGSGPWQFKEIGFSGLYYCESLSSTSWGDGNGVYSDGSKTEVKFEHEFKYLGRRVLGGKWADVYVRINRVNFTSEIAESQTSTEMSYWLGDDGLMLKQETTTRHSNSQRWSRQVRDYNYEQKDFKIEAPIK